MEKIRETISVFLHVKSFKFYFKSLCELYNYNYTRIAK